MKTRIQCAAQGYCHAAVTGRHTVSFHDDDSVTSSGCGDITAEAKRVAGTTALGGRFPGVVGSCVSLAAFVKHGIPLMFSQKSQKNVKIGVWQDAYVRFKNNKVVIAAAAEARTVRDAPHAEALAVAWMALRKANYRPELGTDLWHYVTFLADTSMEEDSCVGLGKWDVWEIPLQRNWLERVANAGISVVGKRFVCGVAEDPSVVYAIARTFDGYLLRRFQLTHTDSTPKLRRI